MGFPKIAIASFSCINIKLAPMRVTVHPNFRSLRIAYTHLKEVKKSQRWAIVKNVRIRVICYDERHLGPS